MRQVQGAWMIIFLIPMTCHIHYMHAYIHTHTYTRTTSLHYHQLTLAPRPQTRKIRCDPQPGGCSPCAQNNTECRTTDRITGLARSRGHAENL